MSKLTADGFTSFLFKNQVISGFGVPETLHSICTLSPSVAFYNRQGDEIMGYSWVHTTSLAFPLKTGAVVPFPAAFGFGGSSSGLKKEKKTLAHRNICVVILRCDRIRIDS